VGDRVAGVYLFATPWAFGTSGYAANAWVVGICLVVATLRVPIVSEPLTAEVIKAGLGAWLVASPFVLGFAGSWAAWNAWIVGALTLAFADVPRIAFALVILATSLQRARLRFRVRWLSPQKIVGYEEPEGKQSPGRHCWHIVERSHQIHETLRGHPSETQVEACILGHAICLHDLTSLTELIAVRLPKSRLLRRRKLGLVRWAATRSIHRAGEAFPKALGTSQRSGSR
jgi:SPW repeat-containing protein